MPEEENGGNINGSLHQFTEYNNSIEEIMTVFDSDIEAENSSENDDARNIENMTKKIKDLKEKNIKLKKAYDKALERIFRLTDILNSKVCGEPTENVFTEVPGFPDRTTLKRFSEAATSDFVFVKLMMKGLWPNGLKNKSVIGRASNNPYGRPSRKRPLNPLVQIEPREQLSPEKVKYIGDRFIEHRIFQSDPPVIAKQRSDECNGLMTRMVSYYGAV
ncbi:uncharacterized protein LOC129729852 isoform X2 [Wyeomyia smithii]|nr:uncharacterized protein LOC129729852 isoform X2 [Wyeomyia smithii]